VAGEAGDGMTADNQKDSRTGKDGAGGIVERSALLESLYQDVLSLVTRTSDFVGAIKAGAVPGLTVGGGPAYTVESMRHTTRLMQVMAWLLTQRAVETGEMTPEEAADPKYQLGAADICLAQPITGSDLLPKTFRDMISQSTAIYRRIKRLAEQMEEPSPENPVHALLHRLEAGDSPDD
jgi:regulator of CtrA degradation